MVYFKLFVFSLEKKPSFSVVLRAQLAGFTC